MVTWQPGVIAKPRPAWAPAVRAAEVRLGVRLPADFLAVARVHQGATPMPAKVDLPDGSVTAVGHLLHFEQRPGDSAIVAGRGFVDAVLEATAVPFAEDIGGDLFCFDYSRCRRSTSRLLPRPRPSVCYWSVDSGLVPLAAGFTDFVNALRA